MPANLTKCGYFSRDDKFVVCKVEQKPIRIEVNNPQVVTIDWLDGNVTDQITDLRFTYSPDPEVLSIHPNYTIHR